MVVKHIYEERIFVKEVNKFMSRLLDLTVDK